MIITPALLVFSSFLCAAAGWAIGATMSYDRGFDDGFDVAEDFYTAPDLPDPEWVLVCPAPPITPIE